MGGYGLWVDTDWQARYYNVTSSPDFTSSPVHQDSSNINVLELIPVWLGVQRFAKAWANYHMVCYTDNANVMTMINKGISSNSTCMSIIRDMFWRCAAENIHLTARHFAGTDNVLADILSPSLI